MAFQFKIKADIITFFIPTWTILTIRDCSQINDVSQEEGGGG